ncbi:hypothetical protein HDU96_005620 [Phlyctochytrium bullatum]|nr:hypothetical protein HDU96_005620 [Phlyctochytrium bullatum]
MEALLEASLRNWTPLEAAGSAGMAEGAGHAAGGRGLAMGVCRGVGYAAEHDGMSPARNALGRTTSALDGAVRSGVLALASYVGGAWAPQGCSRHPCTGIPRSRPAPLEALAGSG